MTANLVSTVLLMQPAPRAHHVSLGYVCLMNDRSTPPTAEPQWCMPSTQDTQERLTVPGHSTQSTPFTFSTELRVANPLDHVKASGHDWLALPQKKFCSMNVYSVRMPRRIYGSNGKNPISIRTVLPSCSPPKLFCS